MTWLRCKNEYTNEMYHYICALLYRAQLRDIILNILLMDPRMVYCLIGLTLVQTFVDECNVSTCQLRALFTYWCHVSTWLRGILLYIMLSTCVVNIEHIQTSV